MNQQGQGHPDVVGWGADLRPENRPGVPREKEEPRRIEGAQWERPPQQEVPDWKQKRAGLDQMTPVFGTAQPPRGLSGAIKRMAYKIPEYKPKHWMLLFLSDRVDVVEYQLEKHLGTRSLLVPLGAVAAGMLVVRRMNRESEPRGWEARTQRARERVAQEWRSSHH